MEIKQWEDKNLSHFSYGILIREESKIVLIDPSRNPQPYLDWAEEKKAKIVGVVETHPHADFASGHAELRQLTGATLYVHSLVGVSYEHQPFDEGTVIELGNIRLKALHTPGHSPDSICIVLEQDGKDKAVFTGDTLFIGDCGRPDLREGAGNIQSKREDLAKQMYHSLREKLMKLDDDVWVYPAHGSGSLCGKNLSKENVSTIGKEKQTNWCLQSATEEEFVKNLLMDQPFVPFYFPFDVELNRRGAPAFQTSIQKVQFRKLSAQESYPELESSLYVIDVRDESKFKSGHLPHSINLMENGKLETWLGSMIRPEELFYVAGESEEQLKRVMERIAAIGYEAQVKKAFIVNSAGEITPQLNMEAFKKDPQQFTIVDVRNHPEVKQRKIFANSIAIPLPELRQRIQEIPKDKPIVVHCAAGYRSAAASSLLQSELNGNVVVYDLGEAIKGF